MYENMTRLVGFGFPHSHDPLPSLSPSPFPAWPSSFPVFSRDPPLSCVLAWPSPFPGCVGPPGKVAQPSVVVISSTSARVQWMSVVGRNSPVSNYSVVYWKTVGGRNNASNIAMVSVNTSQSDKSLEVELTDLMSDTAYSIEIAGVSEPEGPGEYSEPVTFKMPVELKGELSLCNDFMYNVVEAHCYALQSKRIDCEQIRSRINQ